MLFIGNSILAQSKFSIDDKAFEYIDPYTKGKEIYKFSQKNKVTLTLVSTISGKTYIDKCFGNYVIEKEKIKVITTCEDRELFTEPIKETFLYDSNNKVLKTTIHFDQNKNPRIYKLNIN